LDRRACRERRVLKDIGIPWGIGIIEAQLLHVFEVALGMHPQEIFFSSGLG
jgi:hypothetical protein